MGIAYLCTSFHTTSHSNHLGDLGWWFTLVQLTKANRALNWDTNKLLLSPFRVLFSEKPQYTHWGFRVSFWRGNRPGSTQVSLWKLQLCTDYGWRGKYHLVDAFTTAGTEIRSPLWQPQLAHRTNVSLFTYFPILTPTFPATSKKAHWGCGVRSSGPQYADR